MPRENRGRPGCTGEVRIAEEGDRLRITCPACPLNYTTANLNHR